MTQKSGKSGPVRKSLSVVAMVFRGADHEYRVSFDHR